MSYMFQGATSFIQDIRVWTVLESGGEYVANISSMFLNATLMLNEYNRNMVPDPTEPGTPGSTTNAAGYAFFNASDIYTPPTTQLRVLHHLLLNNDLKDSYLFLGVLVGQ